MKNKHIRFDWAIKRLLRQKANFDVLEGFLTELLKFDVKIQEVIESEGNQQNNNDKYNRVDLLAKNDKDELKPQLEKERRQKEEAKQNEKEALAKIYESAKQMKSFEMPIDAIVNATGLEKEEIENL